MMMNGFDFSILGWIVWIIGGIAFLLCVGLSILTACRKGLIKSMFATGVSLTSFLVALFVTMPVTVFIVRLSRRILTPLLENLFSKIDSGEIPLDFLKNADLQELLGQMSEIIFVLSMAVGVFITIFFILKLAGTIVMSCIAKSETKKGSTFFQKKFKGSGWLAALCGTVTGLILFVVISMPFKSTMRIAGETVKLLDASEVEFEDQNVNNAINAVRIATNSPFEKISDALGGKQASYILTTVSLSDSKISVQKSAESMIQVATGAAGVIKNYKTMPKEELAQAVRDIGKLLSENEIITSGGKEVAKLLEENMDKILPEADIDETVGDLIDTFVDLMKDVDEEDVSQGVTFVFDTAALIVERGYAEELFEMMNISDGENKEEPEDDDGKSQEKMLDLLEKLANDTIISETAVNINKNEKLKAIVPEIINMGIKMAFKDAENIDPEEMDKLLISSDMKDMTEEEARDLGTALEDLLKVTVPIVKDLYKDRGEEDGEINPLELMKNLDTETLADAIDKITDNQYIGDTVVKVSEMVISEGTGVNIDLGSKEGGASTKEKLDFMKDAAVTFSEIQGEDLTTEEITEKIGGLIDDLSPAMCETLAGLFTPQFIKSFLNGIEGAPDPELLSKSVSTLFKNLAKEENQTDDERGLIRDMMLLMMQMIKYEDLVGPGKKYESDEALASALMNSRTIAETLESVVYDADGNPIYNPFNLNLGEGTAAAYNNFRAKGGYSEKQLHVLDMIEIFLGIH